MILQAHACLMFLDSCRRTIDMNLQVVAGGNAEKAGIKVGDVIVGVTGMFGGLQGVLGKGIEEV